MAQHSSASTPASRTTCAPSPGRPTVHARSSPATAAPCSSTTAAASRRCPRPPSRISGAPPGRPMAHRRSSSATLASSCASMPRGTSLEPLPGDRAHTLRSIAWRPDGAYALIGAYASAFAGYPRPHMLYRCDGRYTQALLATDDDDDAVAVSWRPGVTPHRALVLSAASSARGVVEQALRVRRRDVHRPPDRNARRAARRSVVARRFVGAALRRARHAHPLRRQRIRDGRLSGEGESRRPVLAPIRRPRAAAAWPRRARVYRVVDRARSQRRDWNAAASSRAAACGSSAAHTALITAAASAPASTTSRMFDALMPPIATTGTRTAAFTSRMR